MPRSRDQKIPSHEQLKGSEYQYQWNFKPWADSAGETISGVSAAVLDGGSSLALGAQTYLDSIWTGSIAASEVGCNTIEVTATTVSGNQTRKRRFRVNVTDPR